jgi:hypothetical protein
MAVAANSNTVNLWGDEICLKYLLEASLPLENVKEEHIENNGHLFEGNFVTGHIFFKAYMGWGRCCPFYLPRLDRYSAALKITVSDAKINRIPIQDAKYSQLCRKFKGGRHAGIFPPNSDNRTKGAPLAAAIANNDFGIVNGNVRGSLSLANAPRDQNSLSSQVERIEKKASAYSYQPSLPKGIISHVLCGRVHGLRSRVHSLLRDQVIYLALAGVGFFALAGLGAGVVDCDRYRLAHNDRDRRVVRIGWFGLLAGLPLGVLCLLLGLPYSAC